MFRVCPFDVIIITSHKNTHEMISFAVSTSDKPCNNLTIFYKLPQLLKGCTHAAQNENSNSPVSILDNVKKLCSKSTLRLRHSLLNQLKPELVPMNG